MTLGEVEALLGDPERIDTRAPTEGDGDGDDADARADAEDRATERFLVALAHSTRSRRSRIGNMQRLWVRIASPSSSCSTPTSV